MKQYITAFVVLLIVCSCSQQEVPETQHKAITISSVEMRLVHKSNPQITDRNEISGLDLTGYFPICLDPIFGGDQRDRVYWVLEEVLLDQSDVQSIVVSQPEFKNLPTRKEYEAEEKEFQIHFPNLSREPYERYLERNSPPSSLLNITFTKNGLAKLNLVGGVQQHARTAIIINDVVCAAPYIIEQYDNTTLSIGLDCTAEETVNILNSLDK